MAKAPKYMDIVLWAQQQIAQGSFLPGDKFLSESNLGARFDVSRQTVRRALDDLEQLGQITRVQGSGTYVAGASSAKEGKPATSMTVGVISLYLDDYIFPGIIRGMESVFASSGHGIQLASTQNEIAGETRALQRMLDIHPAGLIVEPTKSGLPCGNLELYRQIQQQGIPIVFTDSLYGEVDAPCVGLDDERVGYLATEYLIEMGHRNILGIFTHSNRAGLLRYSGYLQALSTHGIPLREDWVHWYNQEDMQQVLQGGLFQASLPQCSAAVCYNDHVATSLISLLTRNGYGIPETLSIISVDNTHLAQLYGVTSFIHPGTRLGEAAAKLLLAMMRGAPGESIRFTPEICFRDSVKRLEG